MIDYMIAEILVLKGAEQEREARKTAEREQWRKGHKEMGSRPAL